MRIVFVTETTGLHPEENDEILQLSIIDFKGNVLFNEYFKPQKKESWPEAMKVNHITPESLHDKNPFSYYVSTIQSIFDRADEIISYNGAFDEKMLEFQGIRIPNVKKYDVMKEFAPIYGDFDSKRNDYRYVKLTVCAEYYGFVFDAHDSLEDVRATLYCYKKINEDYLFKHVLSESTGFRFSYKDEGVFRSDLKEYMNFLFRTDSLKRWENERTSFNQVFFLNENKLKIYQIENKYKVRAALKEKIEHAVSKSSPAKIYKMSVSWPNCSEIDYLDSSMILQLKILLMDMADENEILCCVSHADEIEDKRIIPKAYIIYKKNTVADFEKELKIDKPNTR